MQKREQAEARWKECMEERQKLETERNVHRENFLMDDRPYMDRLDEHQKKLEELNEKVAKAEQEEHEAQMEMDHWRNEERKANEEQIEYRKEMNQGHEDEYTEKIKWEEEQRKTQEAREEQYRQWQEECRRNSPEFYQAQDRSREQDGRSR